MAADAKANAAAGVTAKSVNKKLNSTRKQVSSARKRLTRLSKDLGTLTGRVKGAEGSIGTVLGAAPALISGLQTLSGVVQNQIAPGLKTAGEGLTALKAALENNIAPRFSAIEYGFGQVVIATPAAQAQGGSFLSTPEMSDAAQQAQTSQQFIAQHSGALIVLYGIRSGENDGTGATNPAGLCKVTVTNEAGETATTAPNPTLNNLPFQPVAEKSALTSTVEANRVFPFALKTSGADADKTNTFQSSVLVAAGDTYTVGLSCVDISADANDARA